MRGVEKSMVSLLWLLARPPRFWKGFQIGAYFAGSLLVGINFAKALAWAHRKPLVPVNMAKVLQL